MALVRENSSVPAQLRTHGERVTRQLFHETQLKGGSTADLLTMRVPGSTTGYFVGSAPGWNGEAIETRIVPESEFTLERFRREFGFMYAEHLTRQQIEDSAPVNGYVGTWKDSGLVYIDAVTWVRTRDEAIALGHKRGELAIYGVAEGGSLYMADYPAAVDWVKPLAISA